MESEKLVLDVCSDKLGIRITPDTIERAHRIGRFHPNKNRPIIVKFSFFKHKETVLRSCPKLKDTNVSVSEDYPKNVQFARKMLLQFARAQGGLYKLRVDRLHLGNKPFIFNYETNQICEGGPNESNTASTNLPL